MSDGLTFSQRNGFAPLPTQLDKGVISQSFRNRLIILFQTEIWKHSSGFIDEGPYFNTWFSGFFQEFYIAVLDGVISDAPDLHNLVVWELTDFLQSGSINKIFDFIELYIKLESNPSEFRSGVKNLFEKERMAYRLLEDIIMPLTTELEAESYQLAIETSTDVGADGIRKHLVDAGVDLRNGRWAESIVNSISAVESAAKKIAGDKKATLGVALSKVNNIHGSLKGSINKLFGYASDEKGLRHALSADNDAANVDEAEAIYMLGACASAVTYLLSKARQK